MLKALLPASPSLRIAPAMAVALVLAACTPGPKSNEIPNVPPLSYTPATEVPAETFTTIPSAGTAAVPPTPAAHAPVVSKPAPAAKTAQDQRIAALELNLLNMSNELAWLRSQPANATTPWGTPSPKVVPTNPIEMQGQTTPPPAAVAGQSKEDKARSERIAMLENNMQSIREELLQLRGEQSVAAQASPWGKPLPVITGSNPASATPAPAAPTVQTAQPAVQPAPQTAPAPAPRASTTVTVPAAPQTPPPPHTPPASASTQTQPAQHQATAQVPAGWIPPATPPAPSAQPAPQAAPVQTTPPPAATPPRPVIHQPVVINVTQASPQTGQTNIPPPSREAVATPPLHSRSSQAQPRTQSPQPVQPQATYTPARQPAIQPSAQPVSRAGGEQAAYQAALNAYEGRRYNEAWNGFDSYLADYPNGRFAPNALYWKGEVRYSLGDYAGAILQFKDVVGRFPKHQKAPDALLKIVMSYRQLQDKDNASLHLRILNEDYPRSEAVRRARSLGLS